VLADLRHHAGDAVALHHRQVGGRERPATAPGAQPGVDEGGGRDPHVDHDRVGARRRFRAVDDVEHLGRAGTVGDDGPHQAA
jgi:hypothetical protein